MQFIPVSFRPFLRINFAYQSLSPLQRLKGVFCMDLLVFEPALISRSGNPITPVGDTYMVIIMYRNVIA